MTTRLRNGTGILCLFLVSAAQGFEVRDDANLFGPDPTSRAASRLALIEKEYGVPILIETIDRLPGNLGQLKGSDPSTRRAVNDVALQRDRAAGNKGIYILFVKQQRLMSNVLVPGRLALHLPESRRLAIREAFLDGMRKDPASGLESGLSRLEDVLRSAKAEAGGNLLPAEAVPGGARPGQRDRIVAPAPAGRQPGAPRPQQAPSGIPILLLLGGILLVGFVAAKMLGNRTRAGYGPGQGMEPGMGPGAQFGPGGPMSGGYSQRGGFLSGLMGGLGGALLGNWVYDQFRGHHHSGTHHDTAGGTFGNPGNSESYGNFDDDIAGAGDAGGLGGGWGDGGGDFGGGDFGGGDFGGGGDW